MTATLGERPTGAAARRDRPPEPSSFVARHPFGAFVAVAYAVSWSLWGIAYAGGGEAPFLAGVLGPAVAAAFVLRRTGGSLRDWGSSCLRWRAPLRWWGYALGLPVALYAAVSLVLQLAGHPVDWSLLVDRAPAYVGTWLFVLVLGGALEEPGWRGFGLPYLLQRHTPVRATLVLGLVWGVWHVPVYGPLGLAVPMVLAFFYTFLWARTRSVLLCVVLHASFTPAQDHLVLLPREEAYSAALDAPDAAILGVYLAAVGLLLLATRGRLGVAGPRAAARRVEHRTLASATLALAVALAVTSLLGPVGAELLIHRTSSTTLNQLVGSDLAALVVAAPLALAAAVLVARGHRVGPLLCTGIGVYAAYTYAQVIVGQEYLRMPGNVERFFPLLLTVFLLGEALLVLGWRAQGRGLPAPARRVERATGWVLVLVALFLVVGLHLPTMLTAWTEPGSMTEYASAPTPFWLVKLMDLGIVVPAAVVTGVGLLHGSGWARRVTYPFLTGYALLSCSVTSMALVMLVEGDPDASVGLATGFAVFTVSLVLLLMAWCRPLLRVPAPRVAAHVSQEGCGTPPRRS